MIRLLLADDHALVREGLEQRVAEPTSELLAANRELEAFSFATSHDLRWASMGREGSKMGVSRADGTTTVQWHTGPLGSDQNADPVHARPAASAAEIPVAALVDIKSLTSLLNDFSVLIGMATALLDLEGNVLLSVGWQRACTGFHRVSPASCANCTESDLFLAKHLREGEFVDYKCKNGLWDVVTPVFVGPQHLGNLYCGQFFYDDDVIDEGFFIAQAERYGYDLTGYLAAIHDIPRFSREHVRRAMGFIAGLASYLSHLSLSNLRLRESQGQLETLINTLPDPVWLKDTDGVYLSCNHALGGLVGVAAANVVGQTDYDLFPEDLADFFRRKDSEVIAAGRPRSNEEWVTHAGSGQPMLLETVKVPLPGVAGHSVGVLGIARDITERKRMEEQLRASEREFRTLAENMPDNICRHDPQGRMSYVNPRLEATLGIEAGQLLGKTVQEAFPDGRFDDYDQRLQAVIATGEENEIELELPVHGHGIRHHYIRFVAERDAEGHFVGILAIGRDITELREKERQIEESRDLLRELAEYRDSAREEERKRIAREIHDELGQMLTALRLDIATLKFQFGTDNPVLGERCRHLMEITDQTIRSVRTVASALRPAALDMGIAPSLEWLAEEFSQRSGVACRLHLGQSGLALDENQSIAVFRIVQESLTNVARYAEAHQVEIVLKNTGDDYRLSIRDDGKGYDPKGIRPRSFGLLGIRERALMLGGEAHFISAPEQGSTVDIRLPANRTTKAAP